jgi:hypothetical protein
MTALKALAVLAEEAVTENGGLALVAIIDKLAVSVTNKLNQCSFHTD